MSEARVDDVRILRMRPLVQPAILIEELPRSEQNSELVASAREAIRRILYGEDHRLLVVVGPCSVHDVKAGIEYAHRLKAVADRLQDKLLIVLRTYFEKPRTVGGWKGLINDPDLDESFHMNKGLRLARTFLRDVADVGLPAATEFLDMTVPQHIADFMSWGAIGARTTESQTHRELASGLSMPVGFKNATDGRIQAAVDGVRAARMQHWFASTTKDGVAAISQTSGNDCCHVVLRGGSHGPNYYKSNVLHTASLLEQADLPERMMIDCSHGNSNKDHTKQAEVAENIAWQLRGGTNHLMGVMLESFLVEGRQNYAVGQESVFGQSITDACLSFDQTVPLLENLARAVRA